MQWPVRTAPQVFCGGMLMMLSEDTAIDWVVAVVTKACKDGAMMIGVAVYVVT